MPKILNPKDVTGTTRFNLDFELSGTVVIQLLKEFKKDYPNIKHTPSSVKLIDAEHTKGMEISLKFISFFPELTKERAEKVRKRIYKHIAKKSEVYYSTSRESLELSISSLLADDIRSCASLLYYALHKFINGSMYSFLNEQFNLEDHKIELAEVEHFTSANFYKFTELKSKMDGKINRENYKERLCIKNNSADPFLLIQYVIKGELKGLETCLLPYTEYISKSLFDKTYDHPELGSDLRGLINEFVKKKTERKKIRQEEEVKASIAFAIEKSLIEEENKAFWLLSVLSLRLYWLRQTADYEFDFEVKTSTREMSILLSSVKVFLDRQVEIENKKQQSEARTKLTEPINNKDKTEEQDLDEKEYEGLIENTKKNNKKYSVDISFPSEIHIKHEVSVFLTALHLDSIFKKEQIILVLNLTERITNRGHYFIFESESILAPYLYIYINDDGRWTAWFKESNSQNFITSAGLMEVFNEFLNKLEVAYEKVFGKELAPVLIQSIPMYVKQQDIQDINSVINVNKTLKSQKGKVLGLITKKLKVILDTPRKNINSLKINDFIIEFDLIFNTKRSLDIVPFDTMFLNKVIKVPENKMLISLVVGNYEGENAGKMLAASKRVYFDLMRNFNMDNSIEGFMPIHVTPDELEAFFREFDENENENVLLEKILGCINDIVYEMIINGKIDGTEEIIDKYIGFPDMVPYALANKGLLYFRNNSLNVDESEKIGKEYYEKAIDLESDKKEEYIKTLKQKYYYEMARFYLKRKNDLKKALEYIGESINFGEEEQFYAEAVKLNDEIMSVMALEEVATTEVANKEDIPLFLEEKVLTGDGRIIIISDENATKSDSLVEYIIDKDASELKISVELDSFLESQKIFLFIDEVFEKEMFFKGKEQIEIIMNEKSSPGEHVISAVQFEGEKATGKLLNYAEAKFKIKQT
ncbi:hypothetical protein [Bacillus cereus]|uniref:hypothetical protein n=1 Tax=Bacillus cereus TaxID=1396 RepID=UPI00203FB960|nr:hypothetical protein [Bacillus cereus]MCM3198329.1 hypothetical protein [Bacillus cereus]